MYKFGGVEDIIRADFPGLKMYRSGMAVEGDGLSKMSASAGLGLIRLSELIENIDPGIIVTIADRYETVSTAICAAYQNIPLAHIQGGEKTGSTSVLSESDAT